MDERIKKIGKKVLKGGQILEEYLTWKILKEYLTTVPQFLLGLGAEFNCGQFEIHIVHNEPPFGVF
jgi:hypothetical protein